MLAASVTFDAPVSEELCVVFEHGDHHVVSQFRAVSGLTTVSFDWEEAPLALDLTMYHAHDSAVMQPKEGCLRVKARPTGSTASPAVIGQVKFDLAALCVAEDSHVSRPLAKCRDGVAGSLAFTLRATCLSEGHELLTSPYGNHSHQSHSPPPKAWMGSDWSDFAPLVSCVVLCSDGPRQRQPVHLSPARPRSSFP